MQRAQATTTAVTSAQLERPTTPKLPALDAQACDDAALNAAAATNDKPARSWAKRTTRRTTTSCRLTLELSGAGGVRLERVVRPSHLELPKPEQNAYGQDDSRGPNTPAYYDRSPESEWIVDAHNC